MLNKLLAWEKEQAYNATGEARRKPRPKSKRTFRMEVIAMAWQAGKHNGLDIMTMAIKRQQRKSAKQIKHLSLQTAES